MPTTPLERWLERFPVDDGVRLVSPPRSFGSDVAGEAGYAEQFVVDEEYTANLGKGLARVLRDAGADMSGPALEFGAGTGIFTRALVQSTAYPSYYISDMSPTFLNLTRATVGSAADGKHVEYVVLDSAEAGRWPARSLSLVALRYVLHHVLDWQGFVRDAAGLLRPGGVLTFEEPCSDGALVQVSMIDLVRKSPVMDSYSEQVATDLEYFVGTTMWYLRRGVDKQFSEDKHVFRASELIVLADDLDLDVRFIPNMGYENLASGTEPGPGYFTMLFRHNLAVNYGFGPETLSLFDTHVAPSADELAVLSGASTGPFMQGVCVMRSRGGMRSRAKAEARRLRTRAQPLAPVARPVVKALRRARAAAAR